MRSQQVSCLLLLFSFNQLSLFNTQFPDLNISLIFAMFYVENIIGKGGWSKVYRGVLPDDQFVAVKSLNSSGEALQEVLLEVKITARLQHKHIVSLIGYSV